MNTNKDKCKKYYYANKEKELERVKKWRKEHPEIVKKWNKRNREKAKKAFEQLKKRYENELKVDE